MNNTNYRIKLLNKKKLEETIQKQEIVQEEKIIKEQEIVQENKIVNDNNMSLEDKLKILPPHLVPQLIELLNKAKKE
jgi:uncharacterized protein (DUF2344 family)